MISRLDVLRKFLEKDPDDAFTHYAMALEYVSLMMVPEAVAKFDDVLRIDPEYVPAFQQLGALRARLGKREEAADILRRGIEIALKTGDSHSASEMEEALSGLS